MSPLDKLEASAIYLIRDAIEQNNESAFLFSANIQSIVLFHLIRKAYAPAPFPLQLIFVDSGLNFPEVIDYKDELVRKYNLQMIEEVLPKHIKPSRPQLKKRILEKIVHDHNLDSCFASENGFLVDENAKVTGFWDLFSYGHNSTSKECLFLAPLNNWSELDMWSYVRKENIDVPNIYFSHSRLCLRKPNGALIAMSPFVKKEIGDDLLILNVRIANIANIDETFVHESQAKTSSDIIDEIIRSNTNEKLVTAMLERKKAGNH